MFVWWGILFTLGVLAFVDSFTNFGMLFRQLNSAVFLLVALGLLTRIIVKTLGKTKEKLTDRVTQLEGELQTARSTVAEVTERNVTIDTCC